MNPAHWPVLIVYLGSLMILSLIRYTLQSKAKSKQLQALKELREGAFPGKESVCLRCYDGQNWGYGILCQSSFAYAATLSMDALKATHEIDEIRFVQDAEGKAAFQFIAGQERYLISDFDDLIQFYCQWPESKKIELSLQVGKLRAQTHLAATDSEQRERIELWLDSKEILGLQHKCQVGKSPGILAITEGRVGLCLTEEFSQQVGNTERVTKKTRMVDLLTRKSKALHINKSTLRLPRPYQFSVEDPSLKETVSVEMEDGAQAWLIPVLQRQLKVQLQETKGQSPREKRYAWRRMGLWTLAFGASVPLLFAAGASLLDPLLMLWLTTVIFGSLGTGLILSFFALKSEALSRV